MGIVRSAQHNDVRRSGASSWLKELDDDFVVAFQHDPLQSDRIFEVDLVPDLQHGRGCIFRTFSKSVENFSGAGQNRACCAILEVSELHGYRLIGADFGPSRLRVNNAYVFGAGLEVMLVYYVGTPNVKAPSFSNPILRRMMKVHQ